VARVRAAIDAGGKQPLHYAFSKRGRKTLAAPRASAPLFAAGRCPRAAGNRSSSFALAAHQGAKHWARSPSARRRQRFQLVQIAFSACFTALAEAVARIKTAAGAGVEFLIRILSSKLAMR
jgi:hypothetical protein